MFDVAGIMTSISAGTVVDKYKLIRLIGEGGFGSVWLAYSEILANYCALKILHHSEGASSRRELQAVQAYKKLAIGGVASGLIPIEHVGLIEGRLFYVMPLADGVGGRAPSHPEWKPLTLAASLAQQANQPAFFTSDEIAGWFSTICKGIQVLSDAGLVHRDIKPDNILFIQGMPVVSDVSLLTNDAAQGTRYGTPGFSAPSWYVDSGGKEDMYGIATTLFTALTGNSPDRMGRAAFQWPPQGHGSLSQSEQREWRRLHRIILRATHEKAAERFVTFSAMAADLINEEDGVDSDFGVETAKATGKTFLTGTVSVIGLAVFIFAITVMLVTYRWWTDTPAHAWRSIVEAYQQKDLTNAYSHWTEKGQQVAKWLFVQPWIDQKLSPLKTSEVIGNKRAESEYVVKEGNHTETIRLVFIRGKDGRWRFDDVFLTDLKGARFDMYLSEFVLNKEEADAIFASKNPLHSIDHFMSRPLGQTVRAD